MPKRQRGHDIDQEEALDDVEIDDPAHTPKYFRSSASASPGPANSESNGEKQHSSEAQGIQCILPGHAPLSLQSAAEFEVHYAKEHTNRCIECKANLPSTWLLELHHNENHDPLQATKREREEKTYRCFLSDCDKVCLTPQKRRLHLIDKHRYPKNYDFRIVDSGTGGRRSLLRDEHNSGRSSQRWRVSDVGTPGWQTRNPPNANAEKSRLSPGLQKVEETSSTKTVEKGKALAPSKQDLVSAKEQDVDNLTSALSSLTFVPMSVRMNAKKKT